MVIEVQTTQNVTIDYEIANIGKRILAYLIDWVIIFIWFFGWLWIMSTVVRLGLGTAFDGNITAIIIWAVLFYPILFYDFLFERFNRGQSPGKMLLKIRVVNVNGTAPTTGSFLVRWLFRFIDFFMTYGFVGVIMVAVSKKSQRLGDLLAGTTVIDMKLNAGNRELSITDLDFHEDYKVTYSDVLNKLSDRDIQTIMSIIEDRRMRDSDYFNQRLAERIKSITGYNYDGADKIFLKKIVSDYNFLAVQE